MLKPKMQGGGLVQMMFLLQLGSMSIFRGVIVS